MKSEEARKRKLELRESESSTPSIHNQLKSPRLATTHDQPEDSTGNSANTCESSRTSDDRIFASCGSSNFTSKSIDLEEDDDEVLSGAASAGHSVEFSGWKTITTVRKMPSDDELEEFFAAAEKDLQKKFIEKYNYDIVKDEPLQGRYEWVRTSESTETMMNTKK